MVAANCAGTAYDVARTAYYVLRTTYYVRLLLLLLLFLQRTTITTTITTTTSTYACTRAIPADLAWRASSSGPFAGTATRVESKMRWQAPVSETHEAMPPQAGPTTAAGWGQAAESARLLTSWASLRLWHSPRAWTSLRLWHWPGKERHNEIGHAARAR